MKELVGFFKAATSLMQFSLAQCIVIKLEKEVYRCICRVYTCVIQCRNEQTNPLPPPSPPTLTHCSSCTSAKLFIQKRKSGVKIPCKNNPIRNAQTRFYGRRITRLQSNYSWLVGNGFMSLP